MTPAVKLCRDCRHWGTAEQVAQNKRQRHCQHPEQQLWVDAGPFGHPFMSAHMNCKLWEARE